MPRLQMRRPTLENGMTGVYVEKIPHLAGGRCGTGKLGKTWVGPNEIDA
jgi:hypothetical protein